MMVLSNPGPPKTLTLPKILPEKYQKVNVWTKWELPFPYKALTTTITLREFFYELYGIYKIMPKDLTYKGTAIYISALYKGKEEAKKEIFDQILV